MVSKSFDKTTHLLSTGIYLPGEPIPYEKIDSVLGKLDGADSHTKKLIEKLRALVTSHISIESCHFAIDPNTGKPTENQAEMTAKAIKTAVDKANVNVSDIDLLLVANSMPDFMTPPTTTIIQEKLEIHGCAEIEIHSNCTGISKALQIALNAIQAGQHKLAAVCYSQLSSSFLRSEVYNQSKVKKENTILRWLLSDSASCMLVSNGDHPKNDGQWEIVDVFNRSYADVYPAAMWSYLGAANIILPSVFEDGIHHLGQDYAAVNKIAYKLIVDTLEEVMHRNNVSSEKMRYIISTVPTKFIMSQVTTEAEKRIGIPPEKWYTNVQKKGYSGGSSLVIALEDLIQTAVFSPGDQIIAITIESSKWMVGGVVFELTPKN